MKLLDALSIAFVLLSLYTCIHIWWFLFTGRVNVWRRRFRRAMVAKWCCGEEGG